MIPNFMHGAGLPLGHMALAIVGEENAEKPGTYRVTTTTGLNPPDAYVLSPDNDGRHGEITKPRPGSPCIVIFTHDGGQCYIIGFPQMPKYNLIEDEEDQEEIPTVGNPKENNASGDKVYKTKGGATLRLLVGGSAFLEGGDGVSIILNPKNNYQTLRCTNQSIIADGYRANRGRREVGTTKPATRVTEEFRNQEGASFDEVRLEHGQVDDTIRRRLTISEVTIVASRETRTVKTRETYLADGSWLGEGPKYAWGGEDEHMVLGDSLVSALTELIDIILGMKVNTAWGPSTPPIPPASIDLNGLKNKLAGNILSTYLFLTKDAASPDDQ